MDITTVGSIKNVGEDTAKVMNGNAVVWSGVTAPGPKNLIGGNLQAGFYGECSTSEFITGDELARMIGLTAGISQFSTEPWLKFSYLGKVEFVAKKPYRHSISWDSINAVNAVFGNRTVEIKGKTYKVRLMKGKTEGKQDDTSAKEGDICKGSEWNKLMLPIHKNAPSNWRYPKNVNSPTENWNVGYTDDDLIMDSDNWIKGKGALSWCQEFGENTNYRFYRGLHGVSNSSNNLPSNARDYYGWRPVLELVD